MLKLNKGHTVVVEWPSLGRGLGKWGRVYLYPLDTLPSGRDLVPGIPYPLEGIWYQGHPTPERTWDHPQKGPGNRDTLPAGKDMGPETLSPRGQTDACENITLTCGR